MCRSHNISPDLQDIAPADNGPGSCASPDAEVDAEHAEVEAELGFAQTRLLQAPEAEVETGHPQTCLGPQLHEKMLASHVILHSANPVVLVWLGPGSIAWCSPGSAMV